MKVTKCILWAEFDFSDTIIEMHPPCPDLPVTLHECFEQLGIFWMYTTLYQLIMVPCFMLGFFF